MSHNQDDQSQPPRRSSIPGFPTPIPAANIASRRDSRARLADETTGNPFLQNSPQPQSTPTPQWNYPDYGNAGSGDYPARPSSGVVGPPSDAQNLEEFSRRHSQMPVAPNEDEPRRGSDATLYDKPDPEDPYKKYSLSSYEHPYDIPPPQNAYTGGGSQPRPLRSALRRSTVSFAEEANVREYTPTEEELATDQQNERALKRRGVLSNTLDLYALNQSMEDDQKIRGGDPLDAVSQSYRRPNMPRRAYTMESMTSAGSDFLDEDDPRVTGIKAKELEDPRDIEKNALREMDYKARRKYLARIKIEFNISSMIHRQEFLIKLARALMTFGAPSHRIESQLIAAARILEVEAEFIHLPGVIICSFGDQEVGCSETHFVKCGGRLSLGALHKVHLIYRNVVHDELSAKGATDQLEALLQAPPLYGTFFRCFLAFCLSALICPLAFGGSFLDMWISGAGAFILCVLQIAVSTKSAMYANVFEITVAIFVSFAARGLSSIPNSLFCYTAISSSGIIGILPGYLILSSSLELASKNIVCGSVKMVYALIYTLFLGFGLQIGSDFFLLFDRSDRHKLDALAASLDAAVSLTGSWVADNSTLANGTIPVVGTWTFTHAVALDTRDIIEGCYRPRDAPWFLQPFPIWTSIIIVPLFSILSSLANLQPFKSKQLPVMVVISCCAYTANKVANHYIFNRSDVVSAIGAFTVGLLGNVYSRKMGGTAFTSMVTGVLFLVPSGLSQAGGITANGNGIEIGGAMIAVTIGITVGLFMSQALVYMFGTRKNAAVFSF